jgi:DNA-binding NarL/FixJ family response regulator
VLIVHDAFPHQVLSPKIRELARLGLSKNAIARALGIDWKTVRKALDRG